MIIRDIGDARLLPAYGILFQQIYPHAGEDASDWGFGRSVVEPGVATTAHAHEEHEAFLIVEGCGLLTIGDETVAVAAGQAAMIPAGNRHWLANVDVRDRLVFINVYWPPARGELDL